jgi:hypothetical protein
MIRQFKARLLTASYPWGVIVLLAVVFSAPAAGAETAARAYLVARDTAIAAVVNAPQGQAPDEGLLTRRLEEMLGGLIGQVRVSGFSTTGSYNITYLDQWSTYHPLDALSYAVEDGSDTKLFVTTRAVVEDWLLKENEESAEPGRPPSTEPASLAEAFGTGELFAAVLNNDAAVFKFADLPVKPPSAANVTRALLFAQGQDEVAPNPPALMGVAVARGDRIYLLVQLTKVSIPACKAIYEKTPDGDSIFERCYPQKLPMDPAYGRLIRQAQSLIDRIDGK